MFCHKTQEFLAQRGVPFENRDITKSQQFLEELQAHGLMTTPVTVIDGIPVVGFDRERLEKLLAR